MVRKDRAGWQDGVIGRSFGKWGLFGISAVAGARLTATAAYALVLTDAAFYPAQDYSFPVGPSRNAGDIAIMESGANRPYRIIGRLVASARVFNLLANDPTREDVNDG
jgi:hypothetical protein